MEVAAKRGWRAVFAGGRWNGDNGEEVRGWVGGDETIPFVSEWIQRPRIWTGYS
jgi:hypothetical protein